MTAVIPLNMTSPPKYNSVSSSSSQTSSRHNWQSCKKVAKGLALSAVVITCVGAVATTILLALSIAAFVSMFPISGLILIPLISISLLPVVACTSLGFTLLIVSGLVAGIGYIVIKS